MANLSADGADEDDVAALQRRRAGRLGDVRGELQSVERVPVGVTPVSAEASGAAAEIC